MRLLSLIAVLLCILMAVQASTPALAKRKGGGGKGGGGGGGGKGSSGSSGKGSSGSSGKGSSGSSGKGSLGSGSSGRDVGSYSDRPPSYASLYPDRRGFNAGGRAAGTGDASRPYTPPPPYSANAQYSTINRGQTLPPYTLASNSPTTYYASTSRYSYPGAWGYGYYPIYPYPWWAYGAGAWVGASYVGHHHNHGVHSYKSEFRNITVVNATNTPLIGDQDIFNSKVNITFTDFNNGTIRISPCGFRTASSLNLNPSDCNSIVLDLRRGVVVRGNARAQVKNDITFFNLSLGNKSAVLRTQTISNTTRSNRGGIIAGIVVGCVAFVAIVAGLVFCYKKKKRQQQAAITTGPYM